MNESVKVEFYRQTHMLIKKLRRRSFKMMDIYRTGEFYPSDFRVLSMLDSEKGTSIGEITKRWGMHYSNVTTTVKTLVDKGFATKRKSDRDKRVTLVYITPEGDRIRAMIFSEFDKSISECLEKVSNEEIGKALEAINSILEQL